MNNPTPHNILVPLEIPTLRVLQTVALLWSSDHPEHSKYSEVMEAVYTTIRVETIATLQTLKGQSPTGSEFE